MPPAADDKSIPPLAAFDNAVSRDDIDPRHLVQLWLSVYHKKAMQPPDWIAISLFIAAISSPSSSTWSVTLLTAAVVAFSKAVDAMTDIAARNASVCNFLPTHA